MSRIAREIWEEVEGLLLDEPSVSLDARSAAIIEALLVGLRDGCTLVMVSHYLAQVRRIADTVMKITDGRLVEKP